MHRRDALGLMVTGVLTSSWPKVSLAGQGGQSHSKPGIVRVTRGPSDLVVPADGGGFRYGLGIPFQVSSTQAGLICNLRTEGFPVGDFEAGADLILFDRLDKISSGKTIPITRTSKYADRRSGEWRVAIKHWIAGGFIPFGARRPDGTPHPHAGTGFLVCEVMDFPMSGSGYYGYYSKREKSGGLVRMTEVCHLAHDGRGLRLVETEARTASSPLRPPGSGWAIFHAGLHMAVPDGDDLLFAVEATRGDPALWQSEPLASGVSRWQRTGDRWQPTSFVPIALSRMPENPRIVHGQQQILRQMEPTLIRDTDGSLLFTVRSTHSEIEDHIIRVWRSTDAEVWDLAIEVPEGRGQAPVTLNQSADGTPYLCANRLGHERDWLLLWPLNQDRSGLEEPITVRNALEQFGPPPSGKVWFMDHPMSGTVRLADGVWRHLLAYRIMDRGEHSGFPPAPETGLYVEEVVSAGPVIPIWNFE